MKTNHKMYDVSTFMQEQSSPSESLNPPQNKWHKIYQIREPPLTHSEDDDAPISLKVKKAHAGVARSGRDLLSSLPRLIPSFAARNQAFLGGTSSAGGLGKYF
ncbi:hypothetical protein CDAR_125721 [Caerostris darwini]|uniref:Uncharacterized protein n=1 Tax=Caerostris darwini TaxID=1538125 RepID=A0AAV4TQN9_9ARAC|nr:hypothetical protein CDAR_125721 [Caerostris darwini]